MVSPEWVALGSALLMFGLLLEVIVFRTVHDDPPTTYKLFAVRDKLMRLVVDRKIERHEPHFDALYQNVTILLRSSRCLSGPDGWNLAEVQGRYFAHHPGAGAQLAVVPHDGLPDTLRPVVGELRAALMHLISNHYGILVQINTKRREVARMQKEQAKAFLKMVPAPGSVPCAP